MRWSHLEITLDMAVVDTETSSKKIDNLAKRQLKKGLSTQGKTTPGDSVEDEPEIIKKIKLKLRELTIHISTEMVLALAVFFKNIASQASPPKKYKLVGQPINVKEQKQGGAHSRKNSATKGLWFERGKKQDSKSKPKKKTAEETNSTITVKQYHDLLNKITCEGADEKKKSA